MDEQIQATPDTMGEEGGELSSDVTFCMWMDNVQADWNIRMISYNSSTRLVPIDSMPKGSCYL